MTVPVSKDKGDLEFTGERFIPGMEGQIAMEHIHRYLFSAKMCAGKRVLDAACGEGYGSSILACHGANVVGVDISEDAIGHAKKTYVGPGLEFVQADVANLPFERHEFDMVVSYETIEHHDRHEEMMGEFKRVLKPGGLLFISSPDKLNYSVVPEYNNPFHVKELFVEDFVNLLGRYFGVARLYGQRVVHGSLLVSSQSTDSAFECYRQVEPRELQRQAGLGAPLYDIIVASDNNFVAPCNSFYEQGIHGMPAAEFYSQHVMDKLVAVEGKLNARDERDASLARNIAKEIQGPLSVEFDTLKNGVNQFGQSITRLSDAVQLQSQQDVKAELASLLRMLEVKDAQIRTSEQITERILKESSAYQEQASALSHVVTEMEARLEHINCALAQESQRLADSDKRLQGALSMVESLQGQLEARAAHLRTSEQNAERLRKALSIAEAEKSRLEDRDVESSRKLTELADSMQLMEAHLAAKTSELEKAGSELKLTESRLGILRNSLWWRLGRLDRLFHG